MITRVTIYRDRFNGSASPWCADLDRNDKTIKKYQSGFSTRKMLEANVISAFDCAGLDYIIVRDQTLDR